MDWLYPKRRGPEWKQGWTSQSLTSVSAPPLPLLAIFSIVILLLSLSQYTTYKEQMHQMKINFQLLLFLVPVLLIFFMRSNLVSGKFNFWVAQPRQNTARRPAGGFPWGVAALVVVLLVLVSYQSSFQSKWFAPLGRSD